MMYGQQRVRRFPDIPRVFTILQVPGEVAPGILGFPRRVSDYLVEVAPGVFEEIPIGGLPGEVAPQVSFVPKEVSFAPKDILSSLVENPITLAILLIGAALLLSGD